MQSRIGNTYKEAEEFLKSGRPVLFSGTPCQIASLKLFLRKEYTNLLTVDIICHGVPSPGVWRKYLKEEIARQMRKMRLPLRHPITDIKIESISFRDKALGWKKFSFALLLSISDGSGRMHKIYLHSPLGENSFLRGFLANLYLRPSCYACFAKYGKSCSNLTLGDFWGLYEVMPEMDDNKGMNALLANDQKGLEILNEINIQCKETNFESVLKGNSALEKSVKMPPNRNTFFIAQKNSSFEKGIRKCLRPRARYRIKWYLLKALSIIGINRQKK